MILLLVHALELDGYVAHLLGLVLSGDGEFYVIAFTEAAQLVNLVMVARDECAHFTARHFQVVARGIQVATYSYHLGVHGLHVVGRGFGRQLAVYRRVQRRQLLRGVVIQLGGFFTRLAQLSLRDLQSVGHHLQVAAQLGVVFFILDEAILQRGDILLHRLLLAL